MGILAKMHALSCTCPQNNWKFMVKISHPPNNAQECEKAKKCRLEITLLSQAYQPTNSLVPLAFSLIQTSYVHTFKCPIIT